ncbi:hypothetical protein TMatcc_001724 [Talaromyces marneffei ATCC 18224]|uniref:Uncharacterized protein n=2 Tax=Talaromyces marneffei TaxID=37727 RepID=B6QHM3_TALMQ|nr:uncharacterized protein EYB26_007072 [Talaromyces marneffei]EEA22868.1 conserved hypothetical protein [Talaromyces marneffei ATCC 18224]KAE8551744.1 hypothetical protein EYB25_005634 [Talaromyces marneffei]QGA19383.1 hypothetical protein EYB26_007072 [Talaromyces marneffei]
MSLKRKASFSSEVLHGRSFDMQPIADVSHHLNSRTRKRFRDNRPDQQTVYANTLRLLYQAQKEPISAAPSDEHSPSVELPSEREALDPRQQTLLEFFRPTPASSSLTKVGTLYNNNESKVSKLDAEPVQSNPIEFEYDQSCSVSGSSTPYSTGMDVDMNMDVDPNTNYTPEKRWTGGISWM